MEIFPFTRWNRDPSRKRGRNRDCADEKAMLEKTVELIRKWQQACHETIAVICRDEEETKEVDARLGEKITLVNSDLSTAEFGSGVHVLPVEYTKGLEFDAVLLYHPSEEHYPSEDAYVKLLYVAGHPCPPRAGGGPYRGSDRPPSERMFPRRKGSICWKIRSTRSLRHSGKSRPLWRKRQLIRQWRRFLQQKRGAFW